MKYVQGCSPSFLKLYENVPLVLQPKDSKLIFFGRTGNQTSTVQIINQVRWTRLCKTEMWNKKVLILYGHFKPYPTVMRERYRHFFNSIQSLPNTNIQVHPLDVNAETAQAMVTVEKYCRTHDAAVQLEYACGPLLDDRPRLSMLLHYSTMSLGAILPQSPSAMQITGNVDTHRSTDQRTVLECKKLKPSARKAEMGAFALLYRSGNDNGPSVMDHYLLYKVKSYLLVVHAVSTKSRLECTKWPRQNTVRGDCVRIVFFINLLHCFNYGCYERTQTSGKCDLSSWKRKKSRAL